ncbi:DHH family phosphoesterase [Flavobacterium sp. 3HN19-14]|uniref:DHH family phosphoesterase n=1 Tax=Flavobacterium sp. 3HN19-14 TaxID=3448133 RepID=UPI003EE3E021
MKNEDILAIKELLAEPKRIAIIPHRSSDGDAMGSTLGLYHFLLALNHNPVVIAPNEFPKFLAWLPASDKVLIFEKDKEAVTKVLQESELIFTLDFNALHRTGEMEHVLDKLTVPFIMIDHHQKPDSYAAYMFSDTNYGSTCEMLYHFIGFLGEKSKIDKTIATCIYTGIVTDSGSFRFPSTTAITHNVVADLIERGINNAEVHNLLFDNNSYDSLLLLGRALQNMKLRPEFKTAYITLSQQELDQFNYKKGDTEGIVNYSLSIKGIIFAAIFIEHKDENIIKISFRSQGAFDVNKFAREHFNGGGHINAAGGKSYLSLTETVKRFENILKTTSIE